MTDPTLAYVAAVRERNALHLACGRALAAGNCVAYLDLTAKYAKASERADRLKRKLDRFLAWRKTA